MRITQIDSARFGGLVIDTPVKFTDGLNLWISKNQAGKTTLLTFLEWMLYGPPSRRGMRDPGVLTRWAPWSGGQSLGRIILKPELNGWPEEIVVGARFSDYFVQLMEYRTQRAIDDQVEVAKSGEWDLGRRLLNLSRESFRNSLLALQGNLLDPLQPGKLKQILTSDVGSLVENPDTVIVERILSALNSPAFQGTDGQPQTLRELRVNVVKELDILELERKSLGQHLDTFRELISQHDAAAGQYEQQQRVVVNLGRQTRQLELAHRYYLNTQSPEKVEEQVQAEEQWQREHPEYLKITSELESQVDQLAGRLDAIEQQLAAEQNNFNSYQRQYQETQSRLRNANQGASQQAGIDSLKAAAATVQREHESFQRAEQRVATLSQDIPEKLRERYGVLEKMFTDHRDHLAAILEWRRDHVNLNKRLEELRDRREALKIQTRVKLPFTFYIGLALILPAVISAASRLPMGMGWYLAGLLLILAVVLTSPYWKLRQASGPAALALKNEVIPAVNEVTEQLAAQDRKRRRFIELYSTDRLTWDRLVENIEEYSELDFKFREFSLASRELATIRTRLDSAWFEVGQILPLAPVTVDLVWLSQELGVMSVDVGSDEKRLNELEIRLDESRQDLERLTRERNELAARMEQLLQPVGFSAQLAQGIRQALSSFRQVAQQVRRSRPADAEQDGALPLTSAPLDPAAFQEQWEHLSETERNRLASLVQTRHDFDSVTMRLQELVGAKREAERARNALEQNVKALKAQLEQYTEIDQRAAELKQRIADAEHRQVLIERWTKALRFSTRIIGSLVDRSSDDRTPEVERELKRILHEAPVDRLQSVEINQQLELNLKVEGAPLAIPQSEIWTLLSSGAQQQLALAIRLAMARTASGRTNLPLFLDEPLAELDDERAVLTFGYIGNLAHNTQVLITTCHSRTYDWLIERSGAGTPLTGLPRT